MIRFTIFFLLASITHALGQNGGSLSGKITDAQSQPVASVTVRLINSSYGAATDESGSYTISEIPSGNYTLQVTALGYASQRRDITIGSEAITLDIQIEESSTQLDAVIVTAQKQEEDVQKVPFTVNTISSRQVEQYRLWNSRDITAIVPNLYSADPGDNRNVTSIRGITTTSYDPAVATYIDGVNQFGLDTYIAQLFDVERIEVLSGPQGTLYGRNAMAGVINIITKQPGNTTTGFGEISIGNYGQQRYAAGFRTPLVKNKLYFGIAGVYDRSDGFYDNRFNNSDFDKKHSIIGNYYLKFLPSSKWALTLNVKHNENRNNGAFTLAGSKQEAFEYPFTVNQNALTELIDNIFNSSFVASYAGSKINFSSQTSYQSNHRYYVNPIDGDFSPADIVTIINNYGKEWNNVKVWTQEFKISSPASSTSRLKWTAGSYLFQQDNPVKQATRFGEDAYLYGIPEGNFSTINSTKANSSGIAFFGQATFTVAKKLDITGGLRYDYEHKEQSVRGEYQQDPDPNPMFQTRPDTSATVSFSAISPKATLAYHLTDANTLFASYGRGFRAGGMTPLSSDPSQPPLYPYDPEFSSNIEVGSKNVFFANRLSVNLSLFYVKVNDAQVPTLVLPDALTITKNAGKLTSTGVDLHISATPLKDFQVEYNFGMNDATYDELKVPQNGEEVDLGGKRQIFTPNVTSMAALQYGYQIGKARLVVRGEWMLLGKQYFDLANTISQSQYNVFNTRFGVVVKKFEVMFWGRNLSDEKYIAYAYDFGATHLGNPKNYGVSVRVNF
ncbi:MAG TPA: TonB-dependent receptor [Chryseolinea sp.]|nr:TonB-dependent receptor [Chryseolinea sp.]